jgi:hypothetical protein
MREIAQISDSIKRMFIRILPASVPSETSPLCDIARLPRHLTHLDLLNGSKSAKFSAADFACLPSTLQFLSLDLKDVLDLETLSASPKLLEYLSAKISTETDSALLSLGVFLEHLPARIVSLDITVDVKFGALLECLRRMHRFTALRTLEINGRASLLVPGINSLDFVPSLPATLRDLRIPLAGVSIKPEDIQALPPGLTAFALNQLIKLSTRHQTTVFRLPRRLAHLKLPKDLAGLTIKLFEVLPPFITSLSLPGNISVYQQLYFER